jgi:hypothetical protein
MDYKVKLTKCQNEHHHRVYLTRGPSGPNSRPSGPRGRPAKVWVSSPEDLVDTSLHQFTGTFPRLDGGGGREEWSVDHVDVQPDGRPFAPNQPCHVGGESPLPLYISPPYRWILNNTHYLEFSTCKCFGLVVVAQTKPCRESRVESSIRSSSGSSLGDRWALVSLPFFIDLES